MFINIFDRLDATSLLLLVFEKLGIGLERCVRLVHKKMRNFKNEKILSMLFALVYYYVYKGTKLNIVMKIA